MTHTPDCLSYIGCPCNCSGVVETLETLETPFNPAEVIETETLEIVPVSQTPECLPSCSPEFAIHSLDCPNNPNRIKLPKCQSCGIEISTISIKTANGQVCLDCGLCVSCGSQVTIPEIEFCLKHERQIQHSRCRIKSGAKVMIPVSEYELGLLNNARLILMPDVELSVETNCNSARIAHGMLWESMTLEQKFIHTQMLETVYSIAYMALKKDPTEVKAKLKERDIQRTTEAHAQAKKDRQTQLPSEKRKIGLQEKFLAAMKANELTIEQAKVIWQSQGRVWVDVL